MLPKKAQRLNLMLAGLIVCLLFSLYTIINHVNRNLGNLAFIDFLEQPYSNEALKALHQADTYFSRVPKKFLKEDQRREQVDALIAKYESVLYAREIDAYAVYREAILDEDRGKVKEALGGYQHVVNLPSILRVPALFRLWEIFQAQNDLESAERSLMALASTRPEFYLLKPFNGSSWTLLGFSVDRFSVETKQQLPIMLFWKTEALLCPQSQKINLSHQDELYCAQNWAFQSVQTRNFAWFGEDIHFFDKPVSFGFQEEGYNEKGDNIIFQVETIEQETYSGRVFSIDNLKEARAILVSPTITVESGSSYFVGARIRATLDIPSASYGLMCFGESYFENQNHFYIARNISSLNWQYYAGVVTIPDAVSSCRLLLQNYGMGTKVEFDDLLFLQVEEPIVIKSTLMETSGQ